MFEKCNINKVAVPTISRVRSIEQKITCDLGYHGAKF